MHLLKILIAGAIAAMSWALPAEAQLLFKVEGNGLPQPSYLFGTHHKAPLSILDSIPSWRGAFDSASRVVGEIDMTGGMMAIAMQLQPYMIAPADSALSMVLTPKDYKRAEKAFRKLAPVKGMELSQFDMLRPMVVTSIVTSALFDKVAGTAPDGEKLDVYFQTLAAEHDKEVMGLETVEQQAALLYESQSVADQAKSLLRLLDDQKTALEESKSLYDDYMNRDLDAMYDLSMRLSDDEERAGYLKKLFSDRNGEWLRKLPAIMGEAPAFVAVGALHLAGDDGLVEGLRRKGYTVTPICR